MNDPTRPGYKTTEFWVTILTAALAFASALSAAMGWAFDGSHLAPLIPVAATVLAGLIATVYNHGRAQVKVAAIAATKPTAATSGYVVTTGPTLSGNYAGFPAPSNTGSHVVAGSGSGPDPVVDVPAVPVDPAPADPVVAAPVPPDAPPAPDTPVVPPAEVAPAPVVDDVPPLVGT